MLERTLKLWLKRIFIAAVRRSMILYYGLKAKQRELTLETTADLLQDPKDGRFP
jgi:hypothetical protein